MFRLKGFREKRIINNIIKKSEGKVGYIFDNEDLANVSDIDDLESKFLSVGFKIESYTKSFVYPGTHSMLKVKKIKCYKIVEIWED